MLICLVGVLAGRVEAGREKETDAVAVRAEIGPGPYLVGQGFELGVGVVAGGQGPRIEPPRISGGVAWTIDTDSRPVSASGIGKMVAIEKLYVTRFRIVARRSGSLEIPSIRVQVQNRSGRTRPKRVLIEPVPLEGRPSEFLGGVGRFSIEADAVPKIVRVGQELDFRVNVTGPAAWGMTDGPDLARYERLGMFSRIEPRPIETVDEPPSRTFVYRLRPIQGGEIVLPPVAIASYDPAQSHYVTQVTAGVPIHVVAVPYFDPASILDAGSMDRSRQSTWLASAVGALSVVLLIGAFVAVDWIRRRRRVARRGPIAARQFAARLASDLASNRRSSGAFPTPESYDAVARRVSDDLIRYLELATGRPAGALTPDEARLGIATITASDDLGVLAHRLTARCDRVRFGHDAARPSARELIEDARGLFGALGRVKVSRRGRGR